MSDLDSVHDVYQFIDLRCLRSCETVDCAIIVHCNFAICSVSFHSHRFNCKHKQHVELVSTLITLKKTIKTISLHFFQAFSLWFQHAHRCFFRTGFLYVRLTYVIESRYHFSIYNVLVMNAQIKSACSVCLVGRDGFSSRQCGLKPPKNTFSRHGSSL